MNRINPIHIVVLLMITLLVTLYALQSGKRKLEENRAYLKTTQAMAHKLVSLKNVYANQAMTKQSLQRVFNDSSIRSAGIETKFKTSSVHIDARGMDLKQLNLLLSKLLNATYVIDSMKIKSVSDTKADLEMEIRW